MLIATIRLYVITRMQDRKHFRLVGIPLDDRHATLS